MKIALLALGTRGDIQPYAVLGKALSEKGHEVTMATAKNFENLVQSYNIKFVPVEADFQAILESDEGKKMMKGNPFAIRRNLHTLIYPLITNSLVTFYELAKQSDIVLFHVKTLADSFADQFPEKMIRTSVLPIIEPTKIFANPSFSGLRIPKFLNKLSYTLSNMSIHILSSPIGKFREQFALPKKFKVPTVKNIYGLSSSFLSTPIDFPKESTFDGFWYDQSSEDLSTDLKDFINSGEPPLIITFGSMPFKSKFDIQKAILKFTREFNQRIIVIRGWGLQQTDLLNIEPDIKVIDGAPYDKLFPYAKAIVHHGGVGTTSECLRAGKPFFICPILYPMGDQQFWGKLAFNLKIAIAPVPLSKMTEQKFLTSLKQLITDVTIYNNIKDLQKNVVAENGIKKTIEKIENLAKINNTIKNEY